jgi:hypothetical protein
MSNATPEVKSNIEEATKDFLSGQDRVDGGTLLLDELAGIKSKLEEFNTFTTNFNGQTAPQLVNILNKHSEEIATLTKQVNLILAKLLEAK